MTKPRFTVRIKRGKRKTPCEPADGTVTRDAVDTKTKCQKYDDDPATPVASAVIPRVIALNTTPVKPDQPVAAAAAAAAAACISDAGFVQLEGKVDSDGCIILDGCGIRFDRLRWRATKGQLFRHSTHELSSAENGPRALGEHERLAYSMYAPRKLISTAGVSKHHVFEAVRSPDRAQFAVKFCPMRHNVDPKPMELKDVPDEVWDTQRVWDTYFTQRQAVFEALRDCASKYIVQHFGLAPPEEKGTCATIRMELLSHNLASELPLSDLSGNVTLRIRAMICNLLLCLRDVHERGVIHNDIQPSNFLAPNTPGAYKLGDFESAVKTTTLKDGDVPSAVATSVNRVTPYTAPEALPSQCRPYMTQARDVWAVGVIIHVIITLALPFGSTSEEMTRSVRKYEADPTALRDAFAACAKTFGFTETEVGHLQKLHERLLCVNADARITALEALKSPLFCEQPGPPVITMPPSPRSPNSDTSSHDEVPNTPSSLSPSPNPPAAAAAAAVAAAAASDDDDDESEGNSYLSDD